MEHIKLQLKIRFLNEPIINNDGVIKPSHIIITILDKDDDFESSVLNKSLIYYGENGYDIKSDYNRPYGALENYSFIIPNLDKIGLELSRSFDNDRDRYNYLKDLYDSLREWSNDWIGFKWDTPSNIKLNGSLWTVGCKRRIKKINNLKKLIQFDDIIKIDVYTEEEKEFFSEVILKIQESRSILNIFPNGHNVSMIASRFEENNGGNFWDFLKSKISFKNRTSDVAILIINKLSTKLKIIHTHRHELRNNLIF